MNQSILPRVVIDARTVGPVPHGFARYITRLAEGLSQIRGPRPLPYEPVFLVSPKLRELDKTPFGSFETVEVGASFLSPLELLEIPVLLKKLRASLYHSPTFSSLWYSPCPWVVTVHDLNHLTYGGRKERLYYDYLLRPFALKARELVTVSEFSRGELCEWTGRSRDSIRIVYNAMDPDYLTPLHESEITQVLGRYGLEAGKYFVCLSNPKPHKNIPLLVDAYRSYAQAVGPDQALPLILSMKEFADVPGVRALGGLPDLDARALMSASRAVVFPSLYEGFGLPPVEAASMGASVIVSKIAPHQEGLSELKPDEVCWVEPEDLAGWVRALDRAGQGKLSPVSIESRSRLIARFNPKRLGQDMDQIYRRVLDLMS